MLRKVLSWSVLIVFAAVWVLLFRPTALGGPATYVVVSGQSMEPTLSQGDFVVLREQASYKVDDVITFPVPEDAPGAGSLVIHRIIDGTSESFVLQGDNNDHVDEWTPAASDIRGTYWFHIPNAGTYLATLTQPPILAAVLGGLVTVLVLLRRDKRVEVSEATGEAGQQATEQKELEHA